MGLHPILLDKLNAALAPTQDQSLTRRDARLPAVAGKTYAVIGCVGQGRPPSCASRWPSFDGSCLSSGCSTCPSTTIAWTVSGSTSWTCCSRNPNRRHPELRGAETVHWFLDEIQLVPGWERVVRRVMDTEQAQFVVSGSSARMLSRELHTALRGRGMETVIRRSAFVSTCGTVERSRPRPPPNGRARSVPRSNAGSWGTSIKGIFRRPRASPQRSGSSCSRDTSIPCCSVTSWSATASRRSRPSDGSPVIVCVPRRGPSACIGSIAIWARRGWASPRTRSQRCSGTWSTPFS